MLHRRPATVVDWCARGMSRGRGRGREKLETLGGPLRGRVSPYGLRQFLRATMRGGIDVRIESRGTASPGEAGHGAAGRGSARQGILQ